MATKQTRSTQSLDRLTTMRGWAINAYGGPEQMRLMDLPVPKPKARDLLMRMHGAEVGDWDILVREGEWPMDRPFPLVLGLAGSGTVAAAGNQVTAIGEGDPVYVYNYPMYDNGAWAEYMLVPESYVARAPTAISLTHAGAVPIVGLTAYETLTEILEVHAGEVVLITAAAGGVGHLAVQIARHLGARVVATASRRNVEFVKSLGADVVIDYTAEDFVTSIRRRFPEGIDKALNGVSGETANRVVETLREGGRMVDLTLSASVSRPGVYVDTEYVVQADAERLARLARMIDDGQLKVFIQDEIPFEQIPRALELIQAKHVRGKLVLRIA